MLSVRLTILATGLMYMFPSLDQIIPSLQSLGVWTYWIIALGALFEAIVLTGVLVPGSFMVIAGGILVQQGAIDYFDLAWFVGIGTALGSEISFRLGRLTESGLQGRTGFLTSKYAKHAHDLLQKYGGFALIISRFMGPMSAFVPFASVFAGTSHRKFLFWNIVSSILYALIFPAIGFFFGNVAQTFSGAATRIAVFMAVVLLLLVFIWFVIVRIERSIPFLLSLSKSILQAIKHNPYVSDWTRRHPKAAGFIAGRFDNTEFSGLMTTVFSVLFLYLFAIYVGSVLDFLMTDPIVLADTRIATLLYAFRDPRLIRFFTYITALGDWTVVVTLMVGISAALIVLRRYFVASGLFIAVFGDVVSVSLLKLIFHRPRPDLAYFAETTSSFPSGHAAISVGFYGMICYILWLQRLVSVKVALIGAVTIAFFIGLSRIYLIEHYLTDVLNGYLVGALWLVIGVAFIEMRRGDGAMTDAAVKQRPILPVAIVLVALLGAGFSVARYDKAKNIPRRAAAEIIIVTDIQTAFQSGKAPAMTETITGAKQEPVNIVILAPNQAGLIAAMQKSGWTKAARPGFSTMLKATWAAWTNREDVTAPATPYFWNRLPNDISFQKPTADKTLRKRHHIRVWKTRFRTKGGLVVFVGAASFDDGLKWWITHHIDPNIDAERTMVKQDLIKAGGAVLQAQFQNVPSMLGQNFTGDAFYTDGRVVVLKLSGD